MFLHCNSTYPAPFDDINLNWIKSLKNRLKRINPDLIYVHGTGSITALQDEIDAIELSMGPGLMTTGGVFVGYTTSNYMNAAINVNGILQALDAQIKTNEDDIAALVIDNGDIQAELDATQLGAGLNTDGTFQTFVGTNFLDAATSLYDFWFKIVSSATAVLPV